MQMPFSLYWLLLFERGFVYVFNLPFIFHFVLRQKKKFIYMAPREEIYFLLDLQLKLLSGKSSNNTTKD